MKKISSRWHWKDETSQWKLWCGKIWGTTSFITKLGICFGRKMKISFFKILWNIFGTSRKNLEFLYCSSIYETVSPFNRYYCISCGLLYQIWKTEDVIVYYRRNDKPRLIFEWLWNPKGVEMVHKIVSPICPSCFD